MTLERPASLSRSVEATASNRPVKIAYFVALDESPENHMILDAIFYEAYTRWGGAYTLILPTSNQDFLASGYNEWLQYYDPDFIYSYVDIDQDFVQRIDRLCSPIAFLKHEPPRNHGDRPLEWRAYIPNFSHYLQPISSITTIPSPATFYSPFERDRETFVLTQNGMESTNRFITDNFGMAFSIHNVTHAIPGFFSTLCLTKPDLPPNVIVGTERCTSIFDALSALTDRKAVPIARFAMAHSEAIPRTQPIRWTYAFRIFIGKTIFDRINFWNCRHFSPSESTPINTLVVDATFFDDENLVKKLGEYLNRTNFISHGSGQYQVELHSANESAETMTIIRNKINAHTWNSVRISDAVGAAAIPDQQDFEHGVYNRLTDSTTLKLNENINTITAKDPAHFVYVPPKFRGLTEGQWIVELNIQRHNNLSKYSNVIDRWSLPGRREITSAFTRRLAKPTRSGTLAVLPTTDKFPFRRYSVNSTYSYELNLPDDETFFRHLILNIFRYSNDDVRASIPRPRYLDIAISDKGQNLRGVISMFDNLSIAHGIFTNKYWRTVLYAAKEDTANPLTFEWCKLQSFLPNDLASARKLANDLHLPDASAAKAYLKNNFTDTLEHLVRKNVFYQVANWRCRYCGHINSRSFDNMRIRNECDICHTEYLAPIDIEWKYELNNFIYRSLIKHSGLPVLWTLGFFLDHHHTDSYWYLPEVNLYESDENPDLKNEIDILCMLDGKFYAVEVKSSASTFLNKPAEIDKFLRIISMLQPDIAMLSFERYGQEDDDISSIKARLQEATEFIRRHLAPGTTLKILVAEDMNDFTEFPHDLGWYGRRTQESPT